MSHLAAAAAAAAALGFAAAFLFIAGFLLKRPFGTGFALNLNCLVFNYSCTSFTLCLFLGGPTLAGAL